MGEDARSPYQVQGAAKEVRPPGAEEADQDITRDTKDFTAAIRNRIFRFLRGLVNADFEEALAYLPRPNDGQGQPWTAERLQALLEAYYADHQRICLDPNARNFRHTYVVPAEDKRSWRVQQMLVDPEEHNDWVAEFEMDLPASRAAQEPVIGLRKIASLSSGHG